MTIDWTVVASIGQAVAAIVSIFALVFLGCQIKDERNSADVTSLIEFVRVITDRENIILAADETAKDRAFIELLNFLEVYAAATNNRLLLRASRRIVIEKLRDAIALIECIPPWSDKLNDAMTTKTTFAELRKFATRERTEINQIIVEKAYAFASGEINILYARRCAPRVAPDTISCGPGAKGISL